MLSSPAARSGRRATRGRPMTSEDSVPPSRLKETHVDLGPPDSGSIRLVTMTTTSGVPIARTSWIPGNPDPYIGAIIDDRYEVEARLGEGGMGVVYRCRHLIIDKLVAMKVLRLDMARNTEVTERFLNEARSASSIGNPHIISILDFGRLPDGATYFLMEFLEGVPLTNLLSKTEPLPLPRLLNIAIQLTEALGSAHEAGIVHRDLKPDNIFLIRHGAEEDFVKVLDFGIAKATTATGQLTQAGQVFGTPHYMSPEQAAGRDVDPRSDVYSLGVILFELTTGKLPFDADNFMSILTQHMYKLPPRMQDVESIRKDIPPELEAIIQRCLLKDPSARYHSMRELGQDLERLLSGETPLAMRHVDLTKRDSRSSELNMFRSTDDSGGAPRAPHVPTWAVAALLVGFLGATLWFGLAPAQKSSAPKVRPEKPAKAQTAQTNVEAPKEPARTERKVALAVAPLDAHIFQGDKDLGTSPVVLDATDGPIEIKITKTGYIPEVLTVDGSRPRLTVELKKEKAQLRPAAPRPAPAASEKRSVQTKAVRDEGIVDPWGSKK
jgi:serine/threonine protein kinase